MANLLEASSWEAGIYQIELTDPVLGGPPNINTGEGITNVPILQLANRTVYLFDAIAVLDVGFSAVYARAITAGTGLTGGGDLSANRTISADIASQIESEDGLISTKLMTPLRTKQAITQAIDALVAGAPGALDTLAELATQLTGNDDAIAALVVSIGTKLEASNYTAADVLAKLLTVDGPASGLDADKLDGKEASVFVETTRSLTPGTGLTGGGDLSVNRTIAADIATQIEAETGVISTKLMTPLRTAQAIIKALDDLVAGAPAALDTLKELADALGNNDDAIAALTTAIGTKLAVSSVATAAQIRANTAGAILSVDQAYDALADVALVDGATVACDLSLGTNFTLTIAGNRTLDFTNPALVVKKVGYIDVTQDGTGSRTLAGQVTGGTGTIRGVMPTLSTAANAVDRIGYEVKATGEVYVWLIEADL